MKKTVKSVLLAFAALLLVCSMLACQGNTPTGGESTLTGESENSSNIGGKEFLSPYTIIYASSLGDDGSKIAGEFRQSLRTAIDVNLKVGSDTADPNAYEILIGDTSRPQSATAKQALSRVDFQQIIDYFLLIMYLLKQLGVSKTELKRQTREFEQIFLNLEKAVPKNIYDIIVPMRIDFKFDFLKKWI